MRISFHKLEKLLATHGAFVERCFVQDGMCLYIEAALENTNERFLLYIPSQYEVQAGNANCIPLQDESADDASEKSDEMGQNLVDIRDTKQAEEVYNDPEFGSVSPEKLPDQLKQTYTAPLTAVERDENGFGTKQKMMRTIGRLRHSIQGTSYKMGIIWKRFFSVVRRDDSLQMFHLPSGSREKLAIYISTDLEVFSKNPEETIRGVQSVRSGLFSLLDRAQRRHNTAIELLIQHLQTENSKYLLAVGEMKNKCKQCLSEYLILLKSLREKEKLVAQKLQFERGKGLPPMEAGGFYDEISRKQAGLDKCAGELDRLASLRADVRLGIANLRSYMDTLYVSADRILFENNVMASAIIRNLAKLHKISG